MESSPSHSLIERSGHFSDQFSIISKTRTFISAIFVPFIITRLILTLIGLACLNYLPEQVQSAGNQPTSRSWINIWSHWDAERYLSIAQHGYEYLPQEQCNVVFAPLLPLLMRAGAMVFGQDADGYLISGLIVSNLSLLIGLCFVYRFAEEKFDAAVARRACLYVLICPGTLFLSAVYPMSLFLGIAAGALYYARQRRWFLAMCFACLGPLARPDGALLLIPLSVEMLHQQSWSSKGFLRRAYVLLPLLPASLLWPLYLLYRFGDPFLFIKAQSAWPSSTLATVLHSSRAPLFLGTTLVFVLLTLACWWKLRPSLAAYGSTFLLLMLSAGRYWSIIRFLVILFPAMILLAHIGRSKVLHVLYVVVSSVIAGCLMARFALGHWVA